MTASRTALRRRSRFPKNALLLAGLLSAGACSPSSLLERLRPGASPAPERADTARRAGPSPCDDPRYRELLAHGPKGLARADSLYVVRVSIACTYFTARQGAPRDSTRPDTTRRVAEASSVPTKPRDRSEEVAGWTISGVAAWLLIHLVGIL